MVLTTVAQKRLLFSRSRSASGDLENQYEYQHFTINNRTGSVRAKRQIRNSFSNLAGLVPPEINPCEGVVNNNDELLKTCITFKILLIGDAAVGKTSFLLRFKDNRFDGGTHMGTVGVDYRNKVVSRDGENVKLQIWDTAGQERFRSITHAYYRDAHALLLLFEVTNRTSFDNTRAWLAEIYEYANASVCVMLIGNKCDSEDREVSKEDGKRLADEYGIDYLETSAKTGYNVDAAFKAVARRLLLVKDQDPALFAPRRTILEPLPPAKQNCSCG